LIRNAQVLIRNASHFWPNLWFNSGWHFHGIKLISLHIILKKICNFIFLIYFFYRISFQRVDMQANTLVCPMCAPFRLHFFPSSCCKQGDACLRQLFLRLMVWPMALLCTCKCNTRVAILSQPHPSQQWNKWNHWCVDSNNV